MSRSKRARYTLEFKIEAVRLVRGGQSVAAVSQVLGVASQTLHNWVQAEAGGLLKGTSAKPVSYLAAVIDLFSRQIVGWSMQPRMKKELAIDALRMAWFRRHPAPGLIFHSDRGSQYCSDEFQGALAAYGMRSSMSRKGDCWDNAPTESLWGSLKVARLHGVRFATRRAAMDEVIDWMGFYNHRRLHSTLAYVSPMQFEHRWLADQEKRAA